jgi:hypothetical protein
MSVSQPTRRALGVSFIPQDGPIDPSLLADAILAFYEEVGVRPKSMSVIRARSAQPRFSANTFRKAVLEPETRGISLWPESANGGSEFLCFLRPASAADQEFEVRYVTLVSDRIPISLEGAVRRLIDVVARLYPVSHGAAAAYRSTKYASQECSFSGAVSPFELDEATRDRLHHDGLYSNFAKRMLRRLYPITIIGPELWAKLPPLPLVDPAPMIEDLGNCKMLTCWPELVEPHDPAFLAGTAELRRWIWPYTIQNPADDPDVVDAKLGLRPVNSW